MRYRRLSYRYALAITAGATRPLDQTWRAERPGPRLAQTCWRPAADVYETPTAVAITVDLAGVDLDELELLIYEDALVVQGQRRVPPAEAEGVYHAAEIRHGPFRLELALPAPIDPDRADARYEQGLLRLRFPKAEGG
jgi:HSP20 family protein